MNAEDKLYAALRAFVLAIVLIGCGMIMASYWLPALIRKVLE